jgi:hypothetical protein
MYVGAFAAWVDTSSRLSDQPATLVERPWTSAGGFAVSTMGRK